MNIVELDLRTTNKGVSCEEYSLLVMSGISVPTPIKERMNQHLNVCDYHNNPTFNQSALGTPVTPELEKAAQVVVAKYTQVVPTT